MGRRHEFDYSYWHGNSQFSVPCTAHIPYPLEGWVPRLAEGTMGSLRLAECRIRGLKSAAPITPALAWCLSRVEGIASSRVEGIDTTLREITLIESMRRRRQARRMSHRELDESIEAANGVQMCTDAAVLGVGGAAITIADIERLHRTLMFQTDFRDAGRLRLEEVWIGGGSTSPAGARFVPPIHGEIRPLMDDLARFASSPTVPVSPVCKVAMLHAQFETIHPFMDGNGRVGRALIHPLLRRHMVDYAIIPVSAAIDASRDEYYRCLYGYGTYVGPPSGSERDDALEPVAKYLSDALAIACGYVEAIAERMKEWDRLSEAAPLRRNSAAACVIAAMSTTPAATIEDLVELTRRPRRSVNHAVTRLVSADILRERRDKADGKRLIEVPWMIDAVDDRHETLRTLWSNHRAGISGETPAESGADVIPSALVKPAAPSGPLSVPARCGHIGVRSGKPCIRRRGHRGRHSY